MEIHKGPTIIM